MMLYINYIHLMKLRVTYAKRSYKDKVYVTPLVQYSYRDEKGVPRHKTLLSLAKLPDYLVKVIDEALKRGENSVIDDLFPEAGIQYQFSVGIGAAFVAWAVLAQLAVTTLLKKYLTEVKALAVTAFIIERMIAEKPLSIVAQRRQFDGSPIHYVLGSPPTPSLNGWYQSFAELEKVRDKILEDLYARKSNTDKVFLYDITSSYFEGDMCPLAEYGYNRDGKKGKKQVVIGVICDAEGRPIWCDVFKGNTPDQTTVRQQLLHLKETLGVQEFIFVGDRGMVTNARIEELEEEGWWESFNYITALKRKELMMLIDDQDHPMQTDLFDHENLSEIEYQGERFVLCHNPYKLEEDRMVRERLLCKTEEKLQRIDNAVKAGRLKQQDKIAKRLYRWLNHWSMERFFRVSYSDGYFSFERNEEEIERFMAIDGCYVIRSNVDRETFTSEDLQRQYKDLKYVEQAFRTMKTTNINLRPIRVWKEEHVRGYIFACFLAYLATWEIRKRLQPILAGAADKTSDGISLQEVYRSVANVSVGVFELNGKSHSALSTISKKNRELFKLLKLPEITASLNQ